MAFHAASPVYRQLARASRRLFLQRLLDLLMWCWTGALLLGVIWFFVESRLLADSPSWLRWSVAGGLLLGASVLGFILAIVRSPSQLTAALSLDERFGLKERVTTSLLLAPDQQASQAGQALLEDVNHRIAELDVGSRFPVRLSWTAGLVPLACIALTLVALLYEPPPTQVIASAPGDEVSLPPEAKASLDKEIHKLAKREKPKKPEQSAKAENLQELDDDLDKLLNQPCDTKDQIKEQIKDLTGLEDKIEDQQKTLADNQEALKEQLLQMDRLSKKKKNEEGPGKGLGDAVNQGDLNQAKEEMDRLSKKLKDKELDQKDKELLRDQMADVEDKLERLSRQKEEEEKEEERLKDEAKKREGEIDPEALDRELDQLKKNSEKMDKEAVQDLKEAADLMKQAEQDMKDGKDEEAAEKMQQAADKMQQAGGEEQGKQLAQQKARVQEIRKKMGQSLTGGKGQGRRPEAKDGETGEKDTIITGPFDPKKKKTVIGTAQGTGFKKKGTAEITGEIRQASQEAPEAIERQRIPRAASDMAKGYFEKLGGQKEKKEK